EGTERNSDMLSLCSLCLCFLCVGSGSRDQHTRKLEQHRPSGARSIGGADSPGVVMAAQHALVGSRAPAFRLPCNRSPGSNREHVTLDDYRDRWLVLMFYPRDFSLVCPTELTALSVRIEEFRRRDCDVLAVSTDPVATHERWGT